MMTVYETIAPASHHKSSYHQLSAASRKNFRNIFKRKIMGCGKALCPTTSDNAKPYIMPIRMGLDAALFADKFWRAHRAMEHRDGIPVD